MAAVTLQLLLLVVAMLLSLSLSVVESESESIIAPIPSQLPNHKFDLQTIQECTSSFLDVKECLDDLLHFFHGGPGLPGGGGPPEEGGGGGGPPEEGGGEPPEDGGSGGVLQGMGSGLPIPGLGGGLPIPGIGGGLPGIGGGGNTISPACCKAISGIKKNCWPMVFPNPLVPPMIDGICGPS